MKHVLNAAIVAGVLALATAPAMAQVGVYVGPFGLGVGVHPYHHHRVCSVDYYGYEHCWWERD
jgi:hypothetical protein